MLSVERMDEIARLAIHLNHIKGCAAVTSSGETVMHHTLVEQITTALHDLTAQLQATALNSTGQINERQAFNAMLASDYSADKSGAVTEADEKAFISGLWRVWQARAELARPAIPLFAVPEGFMLAPKRQTEEMAFAVMAGVHPDDYAAMMAQAPRINVECEHVGYVTKDRRHMIFKDSPNMLPDDISTLDKLVVLKAAVPAPQYKAMPREMTDEIGEAIAKEARCCGGIALSIYEAALDAEPEGKPDEK
ncbi:TPA: hypothetical protein SMO99_002991 [Proteus mirabilis]|uniref:Uncharacterized protein n=2 Tax=Morganellaceae TaxID=1903414 RepID=A0AAI9HUD5_MORMO|nr:MULTISPECIES: hypothetical protein [Providencia]EJV1664310.1 hypothetical protein [Klebsiella pneumoniae]EKW8762764.1 hypothetical protein [Morganella morganii]THB20488.1 hypothetical protein E6R27_20440 [Providencia sp. MGF014]HEJ9424951.1 hypothetical protein [Proteus mirabilis]ELR5252289.1 hypothetical protein [Providencia rettgeri]